MTAPGTAREEHQTMEFSVTKSALLNELTTTQGVLERKTTMLYVVGVQLVTIMTAEIDVGN